LFFSDNTFDGIRQIKGFNKSDILTIKEEIANLKSQEEDLSGLKIYLESKFHFHLLDEYSDYVLEVISFIHQFLTNGPKPDYYKLKSSIKEELAHISHNLSNLISNAGTIKRHLKHNSYLDNFITLAKKIKNDIKDILPDLNKSIVKIEKVYDDEIALWIRANKAKNLNYKLNLISDDLIVWEEIKEIDTFIHSLVNSEGSRKLKSRKEKVFSFRFDELYQFLLSKESEKLDFYLELIYFLYKNQYIEEFEEEEEFINVLERKEIQKTLKKEINPIILSFIIDKFEPILKEIRKNNKDFDEKGLLEEKFTDLLPKIINIYFDELDKKFQNRISNVDDQETDKFVKIIDTFYEKIDSISSLLDDFDSWLLNFDKFLKPYESITSSLKKTLSSISADIYRRKEEYSNYILSIKDEGLRIEVRNLVDKKISEVNKIVSSYEDETSSIIREELPQLRKVKEIIKEYKSQIEQIKEDVYSTLDKYKESNIDMYNIIRYWEKNFNRKKQQVTFLLSILVNKIFKSFKDLIDQESILFAEIDEITKQADNFEGIPFNFAFSAFLAERLTEDQLKERIGEIEAKINQLNRSLGLYQVEKAKLDEILSNKVKIRAGVSESNVQCTVCHKNIDFTKNQVITCPFCGSTYHYLCVADWLSKYNSCPMCQNQFLDPNLGLFQS
jgi:hypothetical protein